MVVPDQAHMEMLLVLAHCQLSNYCTASACEQFSGRLLGQTSFYSSSASRLLCCMHMHLDAYNQLQYAGH